MKAGATGQATPEKLNPDSEWRRRAKHTLARVENRHVAKVNSYDSFGLGLEFGTW
eukprot:COSAG03_NODE_27263_length_254_cov_0.664516_1_plen_54_part_01